MKIKPTILSVTSKLMITSSLMISSFTFAQDNSNPQSATGYGDNPNLIKVLAVKAQEKVQSAAEKVGAATERGVAKIKPSVDNTWQSTKEYTAEQATIARDNTREGIDTAVKKVKQTKDNIIGTGGVNIERGSLTQSSDSLNTNSASTTSKIENGNQATKSNQSTITNQTSITNQTQNVQTPTTSIKQNIGSTETAATTVQNQSISSSTNQPINPSQNSPEFSESEIKRQSIPIQTSSADAPVNVESAAPNSQPKAVATTQPNISSATEDNIQAPKKSTEKDQDVVELGVPR